MIESIFGYNNVYLDSKSDYGLDVVNEKQYLKTIFQKTEQILGTDFKKFEFYILFSHDTTIIPDSCNIEKKNKILFWFSDESGAFPVHLTEKFSVLFKSYIQKEELNVFANPLGYVNEFEEHAMQPAVQKNINIFFSGKLNKNRLGIYEFLFFRKFKALEGIKVLPSKFLRIIARYLRIRDLSKDGNIFLFSMKFKSGLSYKKYYHYLSRSKFIFCPKGFESHETFRHIEALHTGGIVISEKMPDVSIYDGNPFIVYNNYSELGKILDKVANNEYDEEELIKRHQAYYNSKLEVNAIALRVAEICMAHVVL